MTTILAVQGDGWASLGYDSAISEANKKSIINHCKYFQKGDFHFAFTGDLRAGQVLANELNLPSTKDVLTYSELDKYVYSVLIKSMLKAFRGSDVETDENKEWPIELLIMWNGIVLEVNSDLSFSRDDRGILALGTGSGFGLGALRALYNNGNQRAANAAIKQALFIAAEYDAFTGLPAHVISTKIKSNWKDI